MQPLTPGPAPWITMCRLHKDTNTRNTGSDTDVSNTNSTTRTTPHHPSRGRTQSWPS